jgi:hypothetical protein
MNFIIVVLDAIAAFALGPVVMPVMVATQTQEQICTAMKGTYDPKAVGDQCKDGHWAALVPIVREAVPQPKK